MMPMLGYGINKLLEIALDVIHPVGECGEDKAKLWLKASNSTRKRSKPSRRTSLLRLALLGKSGDQASSAPRLDPSVAGRQLVGIECAIVGEQIPGWTVIEDGRSVVERDYSYVVSHLGVFTRGFSVLPEELGGAFAHGVTDTVH